MNGPAPPRQELLAALLRPEAYPVPPAQVEHLETHISDLFFAGARVYKVKKAVRLDFLDASSLEQRRFYCEEEVRLNARLAPGVYRGVVALTRDGAGRLRVGGEGAAVEYAVEMERLPADRMLAALLDRGEVDNALLDRLAALLAEFHAAARTGPGVDEYGTPEAVRRNVLETLQGLRAFAGEPGEPDKVLSPCLLAHLDASAHRFFGQRRELLGRRVRQMRIREGHGDLHAGNLCVLRDRIVAYDCIEFSPRFRCVDVAAELAFLSMDLDRRGYRAFADFLVRRYRDRTGDADLDALVPFYKSYLACVRGMVAALRAAGAGERAADDREEAREYLSLAATYTLPPGLIVLCGLPGSGKSYLGERVARLLGAAHLRSDLTRKHLFGIAPQERSSDPALYSREMTGRTYETLAAEARALLREGRSVLVDATCPTPAYRDVFRRLGRQLFTPFVLVHCTAPADVIRARLRRREHDSREPSDAGVAVFERARANFEDPTELAPVEVLPFTPESTAAQASAGILDRWIQQLRAEHRVPCPYR